MDFKSFDKIQQIGKAFITITQKLHGTNAQVAITDDGQVFAGSRTRWVTPENDNYGFATFVHANKDAFVQYLGPGRHYGEWVGPGINSGEGLTEKKFCLFDVLKNGEGRPLPPQTVFVPLLHKGAFSTEAIDLAMSDLKQNGSKLVPGFTRPEGIVVHIVGTELRFKKTFDVEETQWKQGDRPKIAALPKEAVAWLLQPLRLEKLLSKDEQLIRDFPISLSRICSLYVEDLISESQIMGTEDEIKVTKKALGSALFAFVKGHFKEHFSL